VEGCCHGELDDIYATLQHLEKVEDKKIDLLICCGDFQARRPAHLHARHAWAPAAQAPAHPAPDACTPSSHALQAVRNYDDLETMACPPKYRALNTFYKSVKSLCSSWVSVSRPYPSEPLPTNTCPQVLLWRGGGAHPHPVHRRQP
jgi:hypothetical protein